MQPTGTCPTPTTDAPPTNTRPTTERNQPPTNGQSTTINHRPTTSHQTPTNNYNRHQRSTPTNNQQPPTQRPSTYNRRQSTNHHPYQRPTIAIFSYDFTFDLTRSSQAAHQRCSGSAYQRCAGSASRRFAPFLCKVKADQWILRTVDQLKGARQKKQQDEEILRRKILATETAAPRARSQLRLASRPRARTHERKRIRGWRARGHVELSPQPP